jgi:hypothetical protein
MRWRIKIEIAQDALQALIADAVRGPSEILNHLAGVAISWMIAIVGPRIVFEIIGRVIGLRIVEADAGRPPAWALAHPTYL